MKKAQLRVSYAELRSSLSGAEYEQLSMKILDRFFGEVDLSGTDALHGFVSIRNRKEIDTRPIFETIWNKFPDVRTFAPRLNGDAIDAVLLGPETEFRQNTWGIAEPIGEALADITQIDLVIVPLLCFDQKGYRVGYGKGYYDKFLTNCRTDCMKLGLSFFPPVERIDDVHDGDVPLDLCVTPDAVFRTGSESRTR